MPATTKADSVSADILRKIVRGDLKTGALLPKAEMLAVDYGVNRSVVREALKSLEVQNLVQPRRRRGTEVLDPATSLSARRLISVIASSIPSAGRYGRWWAIASTTSATATIRAGSEISSPRKPLG